MNFDPEGKYPHYQDYWQKIFHTPFPQISTPSRYFDYSSGTLTCPFDQVAQLKTQYPLIEGDVLFNMTICPRSADALGHLDIFPEEVQNFFRTLPIPPNFESFIAHILYKDWFAKYYHDGSSQDQITLRECDNQFPNRMFEPIDTNFEAFAHSYPYTPNHISLEDKFPLPNPVDILWKESNLGKYFWDWEEYAVHQGHQCRNPTYRHRIYQELPWDVTPAEQQSITSILHKTLTYWSNYPEIPNLSLVEWINIKNLIRQDIQDWNTSVLTIFGMNERLGCAIIPGATDPLQKLWIQRFDAYINHVFFANENWYYHYYWNKY